MPRQVNAFGQVLSFPDDMTDEQMLAAIKTNEHLLNPNYKKPLMDRVSDAAKPVKDFAAFAFGMEKPSVADQAEATAQNNEDVIAPQMRGAPVRQSVYNRALSETLPGDESTIQDRINKAASADISGQRLKSGVEKAVTDATPEPEGGHVASAISSVGQTIKGAGQAGVDYFNADKDNFVIKYGQSLIDENPVAVRSLEDIKDSPLLAASEATGNAAGSMAGMAAAKLAGLGISSLAPLAGPLAPVVFAAGKAVEWLGPAAIAALPSYGTIREKQILNDPKNEDDAKSIALATLGAGAVGAIEVAFGPQQWVLAMMTKEGRAAIARKFASTSVGEAAIKGVIKGGAIEGAEELVQNPIEQSVSYENPTSKDNIEETLFGGAMGAIGGGVMGGTFGAANQASRNLTAENLREKRRQAREVAQNESQKAAQQDISDITQAQTVDQAIQAANKATSRNPITEDDVHRTVDPTLADIERLTGLKPSEAIDVAVNEMQQSSIAEEKAGNVTGLNPAIQSKTNEIVLPDNSSIPFQWEVVDADQIKATLKNGENQPRDRTRSASDIQIQNIAKQPDFRRLSDSPVMDVGAPVITQDGAIVAGNGRFEALDRAYGQGTHKQYLQSLMDDLPSKGIDPQTIQGMSKPVLVRKLTQPVDTRKLAVASNSGGGLQYSSLELAGIDASRMQGLDNLDFNDLGELSLNNNNYQTLRRAFSGYNAEELAAMQDARGMLSQDGMRRVRNAVLAKAYGDSKALGRLIDTTDNNLRNVLGALTKAASTVAKTKSMIDSGAIPKELDVTEDFLDAVDVIHNLRSRNMDLAGFLSQKNLFGDEINADTREILQYLNDNIRSQKKLTEFIKNVYGTIASIDTRTDNIFGDNTIPVKQEVLRNAKTRTDQPIFAGLEEDQGTSGQIEQDSVPKASDAKSGTEASFSRDAKDRIKNLERTRKLQKSFDQEGYGLSAKAADVRDFVANDGRKRNEAIAAEQIAKAFGKRVTWIDVTGEFDINGVVVPSIKDTIFIDIKTNKAAHAVLGHELSHHMEYDAPQAYKDMLAALDPLIKDHEGYAKAKEIDGASRDFLIKEIVGDLIGDNFTNQKFWNKVAEYNPSAFKRIADIINTWISRLLDNIRGRGLGSEKWVTDIEKAQDIIAKAVSEYVGNASNQSAQSDTAMFQKAWHGSPHDHDRFDLSKIGTGEGAQAYGYGHYFAESKDVAEWYKRETTEQHGGYVTINGERVEADDARFAPAVALFNERESGEPRPGYFTDEDNAIYDGLYESDADITLSQPRLYEVELAPEQDEYLLWDKPLSEQSDKVKNALSSINIPDKSMTGQEIYSYMKEVVANESGETGTTPAFYNKFSKKASEKLHSLGIRGIKYLDGTSRSKGEGSYNYVIFDDKDIEITAKFSRKAKNEGNDYETRGGKNLSRIESDGKVFETGKPVTFNYLHNKESATKLFGKPRKDSAFGRFYEPSGKYVVQVTDDAVAKQNPDQYEYGELSFNNPLVLANNDLSWKEELSKVYDGKTGKNLSIALIQDGYDGVVTVDKYGTSEILDLKSFDETKAKFSKQERDQINAAELKIPTIQSPDLKYRIGDLPRDMREELFGEHAMNLNPEATERGFYAKFVPSGLIFIRDLKIDKIPANQLEEIKSARLADLPPIVIADGRLIDGQHRIQAAREKGYSQLRYIDVTGLIDTNAGGYISEIPDMYLVKKESSGDAKFSKAEVDRTLIAQHNLSIKNLLHVDKIGGLAAPSIAITDKAHPLHGFGEITLLAEKDLIDPKQGAKTFGSDIYSPRYPQLTYDFTGAPIKKLNALLADGKEATGDNDYYNSSLENDPERELSYSAAALYQFLKKEGKEPDIKYIQPQEISENLKPFAQESGDEFDLTQNQSFKDAAIKEYYNQFKIAGIDPINLDENGEKRIIRSYAGQVVNYKNAVKNQGKIDREATRYVLKRQVQDDGLDSKFENYIAELISEANPRERIFQGFTYSGSRRYADHNIDNVIKILKKNLRGGENFNYGLGSIRSKYAPQFKSIKQIRDSKSRLMDSVKFDEVKKEVNQELAGLTEELNKYGTFSGFDNVDMMLFDAATMGVNKSLEENGFKNVPAELKLEIGKFINKLKDMPTEYFEAKVLRAVSLGEFSAAIIPDDSPKKVREILQRNGIEDIRKYKSGDNEDRVRKINEVDRVMFSRASKTDSMPETINIDGVDRPTRNSEGKLIHPTEEGIRNFWRWFSGSKVIDEQGRPLVVYHGTRRKFNQFAANKPLSAYGNPKGIYFDSDVYAAQEYAMDVDGAIDDKSRIVSVYLNIGDKSSGVIKHRNERGRDYYEYIVFHPNQIELVDGNTGAFSDNPDIRFSFAGEKSKVENNAPEQEQENILPKETAFRKLQREWQDDFNRFQVFKDWLNERGIQLSEKADVSLAEERFHAKVANQIEDFRDFTVSPLIERIAKAGFTMHDVADFLEAQHAPEANAQMQKLYDDPGVTAYGVTDEEANAYLDKAPEELKTLANEFRDITEKAKKLRLDNGLLNTDITGAWESTYKHYIPVKGAEEKQPGSGKGLSVKFKPKRRLGHGRRDEAVVENIIHDYERAVFEVEKNRVGKHLVMMAAEISNPDLMTIEAPIKRKVLRNETAYQVQVKGATRAVFNSMEAAKAFKDALPLIDKKIATGEVVIAPTTDQRIVAMASPMLADNEINVYIDGHAIRLQINDELAARAYKKLGVEGFGKLVAAGRALNGYLSKVYTGYNPEFILKNLQRDFQTGLLNLTGEEGMMMAARAAYNYPKMFADLFRYAVSNRKNSTKWIDQYRATGGNTGAAYLSDMERLGKEVATEYAAYQGVMSNLKQGKPGFAARAAGKKAYNVFLKWIYNMNQAGENAMRLAAFKAMIDSGKTENEAAHIAKNITVNFNRKGENGQIANAAWLFFNASVQGQAATMHALFKGKHKGQAWALASAYATIGYLAAASLGGGDEDDYDKIDDYTKERNLLISTGDGGWIKLAVPYGYGFFYNTGRVLADAQRKDELGVLPWHIMSSAIEEMTPFGDIVVGSDEQFKMDQVLLGIMPTAAKIPLQVAFNKQLFSGSELMPSSDFDESQPDRDKMFRGTKGTVYDNLAGLLENIGFDVSPETLKYSFRTGTGGAGALVDTSISATMLKSQGAELDPGEIPFIRTMYHENNVRADRAAFHKARKEAQTTAEELQRAIKKNDFAKVSEITKDKVEMLMMDKYADKLRKLISIERDAQDSVRLDPNLTSAEKRLKLKEMEKRESAFYDQYLDVFKTKKAEMKAREN